jgi:protein ImuA
LPLAVPEAASKAAVLAGLRQQVEAIERHPCLLPECATSSAVGRWSLGAPGLDARLGPAGLTPSGVHEIKPAGAASGACAAALGFAWRLALRRLLALPAGEAADVAPVLWCWPGHLKARCGGLYGPGLASIGFDPARLVIVETRTPADCLWSLEESLKAAAPALVVGVLDEVGPTPARRLALAAASFATPCLLVTGARAGATHGTASRWRIAPAPGGRHPFDVRAPGAGRVRVDLERVRPAPPRGVEDTSFVLEWSDEAHRFGVVPALASGAAAPGRSSGGAAR